MWNSNILSMRPYETCVPEWVKNESMFLNPGTVSHRFKSIQLNRIEAPAAKLRSPNDLDVKKCVLEAAKSTRSTSNRWDVFCGSLHCFFVFFYGSLKLCIAGSLASGRWRQPWIRWPRATVRKESNLEWDPFHIELLLILPGTKSMQVPYTCKHCKPWFHSI